MMFDLRKFWLGTAAYGLIIGVVIAAVGAAFSAFIGMPTKGYQQVVTQTAPIQAEGGKGVPVEIEREVAAPSALPLPPLVHRPPATTTAVAMTPPQIIMRPVPQIIVPEPKSPRRGGPSRLGF
jgi:hypothetical protein